VLEPGRAVVSGTKSCLVSFACPETIRHFTTAVDYSRADYTAQGGSAPERHRLVAQTWRDVGDPRPVTFAMLLVPFRGKNRPEAEIQPLGIPASQTGQTEAFSVSFGDRTDILCFNPGKNPGSTVGKRKLTGLMAARIGGKWIECPAGSRA
jgi:hypothetical protein